MKTAFYYGLIIPLLLLSCGPENNTDAKAQEQVDSIVAAKMAVIETQLKQSNDSIINAMAAARADSILGKKAITGAKDSLRSAK